MICKYCRKELVNNTIRANSNVYCSPRCLTNHVKLQQNIDAWLSTKMVVAPINFEEVIVDVIDWRD